MEPEVVDSDALFAEPAAPLDAQQTDASVNSDDYFGSPSASSVTTGQATPSFMETVGQAAKHAFTVPAVAAADLATNPVTMAKAIPYAAGMAGTVSGIPGGTVLGQVAGRQVSNEALRLLGHQEDIPSTTSQVIEGAMAGAAELAGPAMAMFKTPASLKSAGVTAKVLEDMAPGEQIPEEFGKAVERQLLKSNAIGTTANETFRKMIPLKEAAGKGVQDALDAIRKTATASGLTDPLMVEANAVLRPLQVQLQKSAAGIFSKTQDVAKPVEQAYDGLLKMAQRQGGKLSLDDIEPVMKETGQLMHSGSEEVQVMFSRLYGRLADVRDTIVNGVAKQAGNQNLATNLLKNNADYSTYMRLLPSVTKAAYRETIKEGVSAFQKHGGPLIAKWAAIYGVGTGIKDAVEKALHPHF